MAYLEWDADWKDTRTGKTGTYRCGSTGLQTEDDVKRHIETNLRNLEFVAARLVGEGHPKVTPTSTEVFDPIDTNHAVADLPALKKNVREFLKR